MALCTDWYLLKTLTQFEANACRHIEYPCHSPNYVEKPETTYLPTPSAKAFLPGYIFARSFSFSCLSSCFSAKPRLFMVFSHIDPEKHTIMRPFTLPHHIVETLQHKAKNYLPDTPQPLWQELIGKKVRIRSGPFMGQLAKIKSIHPPSTVKLRLCGEMLGKSAFLSMNLEDL